MEQMEVKEEQMNTTKKGTQMKILNKPSAIQELNDIMKKIVKATAQKYKSQFRNAIKTNTETALALFDNFCAEKGITERQETIILRKLYFDIVFDYCGDLDERLMEMREMIQNDKVDELIESKRK